MSDLIWCLPFGSLSDASYALWVSGKNSELSVLYLIQCRCHVDSTLWSCLSVDFTVYGIFNWVNGGCLWVDLNLAHCPCCYACIPLWKKIGVQMNVICQNWIWCRQMWKCWRRCRTWVGLWKELPGHKRWGEHSRATRCLKMIQIQMVKQGFKNVTKR